MAKSGLPRIVSDFDSLEIARRRLEEKIPEAGIDIDEEVTFIPLGVHEAIGNPSPKGEYPLEQGVEKLMEASFRNHKGQAFTSHPSAGTMSLEKLFSMPLESQKNRALCTAGINALGAAVGAAEKTVHCRDSGPELCGRCMSRKLLEGFGTNAYIGIIGYNPGIIENIVFDYGSDHVFITDLNPATIGTSRYGVEVWNGFTDLKRICKLSTVLLVTGSTLVNNTLDMVRTTAEIAGKNVIYYGTTIAATASLLGYRRWCFEAN